MKRPSRPEIMVIAALFVVLGLIVVVSNYH